jgi:poly(3-hydroxybutyrate) depolymerase
MRSFVGRRHRRGVDLGCAVQALCQRSRTHASDRSPSFERLHRAMMYHAYDAHCDLMHPLREGARLSVPLLQTHSSRRSWTRSHELAAALEIFTLAQITHRRPSFDIDHVVSGGREVGITEEVFAQTPFGTLLHFRKQAAPPEPRVIIVAPMSGHFSTLLRDTVSTMLADHDVYLTDWHNARDVPLSAGRFGLDEYIAHLMDFLTAVGPGAHMLAICQPCVAALAATSIMAEDGHACAPSSVTLMAGPLDCRVSPTSVNKLATSKPLRWFESKLISPVPFRYPGASRRVYPGFLQLLAFMRMNPERHSNAFKGLYSDLLRGDVEKIEATKAFYREYFAVCDMPAEFFLETVRHVFQEYSLAAGRLKWRGRVVDPAAIRRTALLTIEGERDDICALGQTLVAQDMCSSLRPYMKTHYVQPGVGHYGVFSGRRWKSSIYPMVRETIHASG